MKRLKAGKDYIGVGGGVLIFNQRGEVFLAKRFGKVKNEKGWWSKPGGSIEYGEKAVAAMKREIKEEHGIDIKIWGYLPHTDHIIKKDGQHWLAVNYLADLKSGTPRIMEPEKCAEIGWFKINKLPRPITRTTSEPIKDYLKRRYIRI